LSRFLDWLIHSPIITVVLTVLTFGVYSLVLGLSAFPGALLFYAGSSRLLADFTPWDLLGLCILAFLSAYVFFACAAVVFGVCERLLMTGAKPGRYPINSGIFIRWLINGGLHTVALNTFLPFIQGTAIFKMFLRLCGCRIGRDVFINTVSLHDAYLLTLEDGVVIGGRADLTCHLFENGELVLDTIVVGKGSLIGANAYIGPGIHIGEACNIGTNSYLRRGRSFPDRSTMMSLPAMPIRQMVHLLRSGRGWPEN
jgi:acetyltransferase-like isoleucine patch superfamily enzyme